MKIICETSNKTVLSRLICKFRTIKRVSYLTNIVKSIRKMSNLKVSYTSRRKNSDGFQKVMEIKDVEICNIITNIKEASLPFVSEFIKYASQMAEGNYMTACDGIVGEFSFINATLANFTALNMFPQGDYKSYFHFADDVDSKVFNLTLISHITKF